MATPIDGRERAMVRLPDSRFQKWGRRLAIGLICVHVALLPWELYRRIRQVLRADLVVSSEALGPGATVSIDVVTSGEIRNRIVLELVQDRQRQILLEFHGELNRSNVYDVRTYRYTRTATLTPELLARFKPGPAVVSLTGYGGMKLLRTPSPVVQEQRVTLLP
jgi:hypothetical protein